MIRLFGLVLMTQGEYDVIDSEASAIDTQHKQYMASFIRQHKEIERLKENSNRMTETIGRQCQELVRLRVMESKYKALTARDERGRFVGKGVKSDEY